MKKKLSLTIQENVILKVNELMHIITVTGLFNS